MKAASSHRPLRVGLVSLGCAKNLVDAEIMLGSILKAGFEITNDPAQADALIVNTCSFIDAAQEESVDTILESDHLRRAHHPGQALIVAGCLPQRFRDDLPKLMPEVDAFMGIDQVTQVHDIVRQALARRAGRGTSPSKPNAPRARKQIADRLAGLEMNRPASPGEASKSLRRTDKFGKTRTVVAPAASCGASSADPAPALVDVHLRPSYIPDYATPRFRLTPRHFAYVKIAEGCNHPCSFCIIPRMRGAHRSRPQHDVVEECRRLLAAGVKELNLISQDTTYYGLDLRAGHSHAIASPARFSAASRALPADATTLCTLLRELDRLPGDFWIRLLYTHPAHWTDELIQTIAACPKVARYVDIPLQHIHEVMLERMRRETSQQYILDLLRRIRAGIPGIALRTTFIVGFPGESAACFQTLLEFIRETRFERLGVFAYSQEDGTRAGNMAGQIPTKVRQQRRRLVMAEQHRIARDLSAACVGRTLKVLVEKQAAPRELDRAGIFSWEHGLIREPAIRPRQSPSRDSNSQTRPPELPPGRYLVARGEADAPDIDGRVYIRGQLPAGEFATARIIGHTDYDLIAEPADQ